jgi:glycosyltransferase involved in cell wall biosynthesis
MDQPLISICIPAYKKPQFVVRCIHSILQQTYKHVEVIISDDSPDEDIKSAIEPYINKLTIQYFHNQPSLKSPKNWNAALDKGKGEFLILMHQDDWFYHPKALELFLAQFKKGEKVDFVFSQNTAIDEEGKKYLLQARPQLLNKLSSHPNHLLLAQVIGPPSNTMIRKSVLLRYDENFIWLVDVDYYSRLLKEGYTYRYIPEHLVSIGLHDDQTTVFCRTDDVIILKENIFFANKLEKEAFNDILIFDYYWRLLRNYKIRNTSDLFKAQLKSSDVPQVIIHMLQLQSQFSSIFLKNGIFSKATMAISYSIWRIKN